MQTISWKELSRLHVMKILNITIDIFTPLRTSNVDIRRPLVVLGGQ
jgi:hypothetical protein